VVPVPGPSAVLAALVASGLPTGRFAFLGFPERKGRERGQLLERVARSEETVVLFESPQRLRRLLEDLREACGPERNVVVARELTKLHEEIVRGTLEEALRYYDNGPPKGEVTVVVAPSPTIGHPETDIEAVRQLAADLLADGTSPSRVAREVADRLDLARNEAYRIVHDLDTETDSE
jgi:16S rRNA (cytidine1402-2'-O)-methyltransferase